MCNFVLEHCQFNFFCGCEWQKINFFLYSPLRCHKRFFSDVGGGRFSKANSLLYNILHVIVPIGGGDVAIESSELT